MDTLAGPECQCALERQRRVTLKSTFCESSGNPFRSGAPPSFERARRWEKGNSARHCLPGRAPFVWKGGSESGRRHTAGSAPIPPPRATPGLPERRDGTAKPQASGHACSLTHCSPPFCCCHPGRIRAPSYTKRAGESGAGRREVIGRCQVLPKT